MQMELENLASASDYFRAALRRAAHRAFMASESFFLPAAVSPPFFFAAGALAAVVVPLR
jgi:hypothetical protein